MQRAGRGHAVLSVAGLVVAALAGLGLMATLRPGARWVPLATACLAGVAALPALAVLGGAAVAPLALPVGPPFPAPWNAVALALDPLSAWFVLLLALVALPAGLFAAAGHALSRAEAVALPVFIAGMLLCLLAGDALTLLLGFEAMSIASWALVAARHGADPAAGAGRRAARLYLGFAIFSGLCLMAGLALLAIPGLGFDAIRAAPPQGALGAVALALVLLGAGSKLGLLPFHLWLPLAHPAAATPVSALMSGAMVKVALYVLLRVFLDFAGPAQAAGFGPVLVALGAATALVGALRANIETDIKAILACSTLENMGLLALGLGLALIFRGADLAPLAALALSAVLLHAMAHAGFKTLLFLAAGTVAGQAGSRSLDRLGGLVHRMPWVAGLALLGAASAAALPPFSGFAGEWLLLQSLLQSWRVAALPVQLLAAAALAATAMAVALAAGAMLRLVGLVFLGRPRGPAAAGAQDARGLERTALLVPALASVLIAVLAAPLLGLAGGAIAGLLGQGAAAPVAGLDLALAEAGVRYPPWGVALLLAGIGAALWWGIRRAGAPVALRGPAWDCGFQPAPPDLPFGDPLAQVTGAGSAQPVRRSLGGLALAEAEAFTPAAPGSTAPARLRLRLRDRGFALLLAPLARARRWGGHQAERLRGLSLRASLRLAFGTLVGLLALLAFRGAS